MTSCPGPAVLAPDEVRARCSPARAVQAVEDALHGGLDPAGDLPRSSVEVKHGELLLMPAGAREGFRTPGIHHVGVKVATVTPANPAAGLPRIQASYLLFEENTLSLLAVIDGTALTALRTPAVSVAAVRRHLLRSDGPLSAVLIGSGPQAVGHAAALRQSLGADRRVDVTFLARDPARAVRAVPVTERVVRLGSPRSEDLLREAGVVVCATTAREPVLDAALLREGAVVIAVGSHQPDAREVDASLCRRATVVVEDPATAMREAGDVVLAVAEGALDPADLVPMRDLVTGAAEAPLDRPLLFKSVGMSWEDLVVASAVMDEGS